MSEFPIVSERLRTEWQKEFAAGSPLKGLEDENLKFRMGAGVQGGKTVFVMHELCGLVIAAIEIGSSVPRPAIIGQSGIDALESHLSECPVEDKSK